MWDLPGPGLEPVSPALAGGFLTTVPPGKPDYELLKEEFDTKKPELVLPKFHSCLSIHFPGIRPSPLKEGEITLLGSLEVVN